MVWVIRCCLASNRAEHRLHVNVEAGFLICTYLDEDLGRGAPQAKTKQSCDTATSDFRCYSRCRRYDEPYLNLPSSVLHSRTFTDWKVSKRSTEIDGYPQTLKTTSSGCHLTDPLYKFFARISKPPSGRSEMSEPDSADFQKDPHLIIPTFPTKTSYRLEASLSLL